MGFGVFLGFVLIKLAQIEKDSVKSDKIIKYMVFFAGLASGLLCLFYANYGIVYGDQTYYTTFLFMALSGALSLSTIPNCTYLIQNHTPVVNEAITVGIIFWVANISGYFMVEITTFCKKNSETEIT